MGVQVSGLDHVVLNVADPRATAQWYVDQLGCTVERLAEWEAGDALFLSVRVDDTMVFDLLAADRTGVNVDHVCVVVDPDTDLAQVAASGEFEVVMGPVRVWGARGMGDGLYVRDPDGNTVELRVYPS